ncbi:WD40 repeat-like protein [Leucogyrophana mollusca]|uniref:WD40 repeat-like protein n=1 Tax=Leucogyrophana mollusca TaxID=85980 RepID=A0ACB8BTM6_9AGAM|nr:WD40 repeat-like protein [Leucogyrophana mollusca]
MFRAGAGVAARSFHDVTASLPGVPSSSNRSESPWRHPKRKQTLLSLIDALSELSHESGHDNDVNSGFNSEDDKDVPSVDERLQIAGAEAFNRFEKRIECLDKELRNFANAARQLGSSVGILSSAFRLRERLTKVMFLFRENAATLFPRKVQRQSRDSLVNPNLMDRRRQQGQRRNQAPLAARLIIDDSLEPETFPEQFENFARDVVTFLNCLNEFPEFTDEAVNTSMRSFEGDLKYWASCLQEYKTQFRYPAVQRYIHDLTSEIGDHIDNITGTLSMFIEIGVPTIRFAQQHAASNLLNLSTVSTFFSAVTATTLQFSYAQTGDLLSDAVNAFWFSSLVFSIAAAVNSLLGLTWKQAMYRSPGHRVPWWVLIWIKRSPLVFLVMSVACFSAGLMLFAYSSHQGAVTATITTVFTAVTSFGLAAVSAWFASERWIFVQHRGHVWLEDVISEAIHRLSCTPAVVVTRRTLQQCINNVYAAHASLRRLTFRRGRLIKREEDCLPFHHIPTLTITTPPHLEGPGSVYSTTTERPGSSEGRLSDESESTTTRFDARERFISAIRSVILLQAPARPMSPRRASSGDRVSGMSPTRFTEPAVMSLRGSRVATLVPKLKSLEPTQELPAHQALVRHLQFSPNGKFLATSSWDKTSVIFRVGEPFTTHRLLVHVRGFIGQVAWSDQLLPAQYSADPMSLPQDGVCRRTIDRQRAIQSIAWLPGGEGELLLFRMEGTMLMPMLIPSDPIRRRKRGGETVLQLTLPRNKDLQGKILEVYHFSRITLHNVAVTPDSQRLLGVGALQSSPHGLQPSKSTRVEKRVIVFNMGTGRCEKKGFGALISYEHKTPPQLWKLELVKDRDHHTTNARLNLRHTYMPRGPVDFVGPSYFGGKDDQLVLCAGKGGDVHIWDRDSAALLHYVRPHTVGGDLTCIAWNHGTDDPFMFATGCHDGTVHIWSTPNGDARSEYGSYSDRPTEGSSELMMREKIMGPLTV